MDYILAILPLILSNMMIPPLSYLRGTEDTPEFLKPILERLYLQLPFKLRSEEYVTSLALILDKNLMKKPFLDAGWLTSLFVHSSYMHLLGNMISLYFEGRRVFYQHGACGLYYLYFIGGVVASWPSSLTEKITTPPNNAIKANDNTDFKPLKMIMTLKDVVQEQVSNILGNPIACEIGCSGAVCALVGYNISSLSLQLTLRLLNMKVYDKKPYIFSKQSPFTSYSTIISPTSIHVPAIIYEVITKGMFIRNECNSLSHPMTIDGATVGHGNHLQGIFFGLGAGFVLDWVPQLIIPAFRRYLQDDK